MSGADNSTESDWLGTGATLLILWIAIITIILFVVISLVLLIYRCLSQMKTASSDYRLGGHMKNVNPSPVSRYRRRRFSDPEMFREKFESVTFRRESQESEEALRKEIEILKIKLDSEREKSDHERRESERKFDDMEHEIERLKVLSHERKVEEYSTRERDRPMQGLTRESQNDIFERVETPIEMQNLLRCSQHQLLRPACAHGYSLTEEDDTLKSPTESETEAAVSLLAADGQKQPFSSLSGDVSRVYFTATSDEQSQTEHETQESKTKTAETQADSWQLWSYQLGIEDPEKICQRLSKVEEELPKIKFDIDKSLADLQQSEPDNSRAEIYLKISQLYSSIGKFDKALIAVTLAIELLGDPVPDSQKSRKLLLMSLCNATQACIGTFDAAKAVVFYEQARNALLDLPDSAPEYETLRCRVDDLQRHIAVFAKAEDNGITKSVGPRGEVLEFDDCTIYFPNTSLLTDTLLHATTDVRPTKSPHGRIPITPTLRLNPSIELRTPATVELATWLVSDDATSVDIYWRPTENSEWELLQQGKIQFSQSGRIEFQTSHFCEICAFSDLEKAAKSGFRMETWLFYEPRRRLLANCIFPQCKTYKKEVSDKMQNKRFMEACSDEPSIEVRVGDMIEVGLENIQDNKDRDQLYSKKFPITMEFLEANRYKAQNLRLPKDCTGLVDFTHIVNHYSGRGQLISKAIDHEDRVEIGIQQQGQTTYNTFANMAAVGGSSMSMPTTPIHRSSVDVRQTFHNEGSSPHETDVHTNIGQNIAIDKGNIKNEMLDSKFIIAYTTVVAADEDRNRDGINESTV